ncbi:MAG TPA: transposase [Mycobacterium sp.]|nr:transposase [Mycobacterium sp.]HKP42558.1 transposase [Mycobacterium sp.]
MVGIDRGAAVSAALSTGELLHVPGLTGGEAKRLKVLQQRLARCQRGSNRRARTKQAVAKLKAREADRRKDWVEKVTTDIARRFDTIRIEALDVRAMTRTARGTAEQPGVRVSQKRGLNHIAAGRAVTARGDLAAGRSANREPQLATPAA